MHQSQAQSTNHHRNVIDVNENASKPISSEQIQKEFLFFEDSEQNQKLEAETAENNEEQKQQEDQELPVDLSHHKTSDISLGHQDEDGSSVQGGNSGNIGGQPQFIHTTKSQDAEMGSNYALFSEDQMETLKNGKPSKKSERPKQNRYQ